MEAITSQPYLAEHAYADDYSPVSSHSQQMTSLSANGGDAFHDDDTGAGTDDQQDGQDKDPSAAPAWANQKTKAGKDRRRLPQACIQCRRRKIKCSGDTPVCKHCARSRIPCVYKVTTRKAAPRTDYMAMLDRRLKRMEERVIKIMPKSDKRNLDVIGRAVVKPAQPGPPKQESKKRAAQDALDSDVDKWASSNPQSNVTKASLNADAQKHDLMTEGAGHLPSMELQLHLSEVYFDYVYGQSYPLLHKPSYMRSLKAGAVPPVLVLSVCAIAARFSTHPEVRSEPVFLRGEMWAKPAREIALKRYDSPSITVTICYVILGLHEFGTCQGGRSWMLGGMAQRMAYALQLQKENDVVKPKRGEPEADIPVTDREVRRRAMWACYMMDRFNSSGTDRPLFIAEGHVEAQLPIKEQYFQMEIPGLTEQIDGSVIQHQDSAAGAVVNPKDNMGVAAYLVRALSLWGRVVQYLNLGGRERDLEPLSSPDSDYAGLKRALQDYRSSLPESMKWNESNLQSHAVENIANQFVFLHIVIQQVTLFMNRFALPVPGQNVQFARGLPQEFMLESARAAMEAAKMISTIINYALDYRVTAPFAGYATFLSSTVHLAGLASKNPTLEATSKQHLALNVRYLTQMKKYWGTFHFVAEHLKDLYRRQMDANSRSQQDSGSKAQEGIFQYGDWFDKYPHGVDGGEFEESSSDVKKEAGADTLFGHKDDLQSVDEFFAKLPPGKRPKARKIAKRKQSKSTLSTRPKTSNPGETNDLAENTAVQEAQQFSPAQMDSNPMLIPQQNPAFLPMGQGGQAYATNPIPHDIALLQAQQQHRQQQQFAFQQNQQQQTGIMSELDRQMVLSSYAGLNGANNNPGPALGALDSFVPLPGDVNMSDGAASAFGFPDQSGMGLQGGDPLSWFMPFNHEPPPVSVRPGTDPDSSGMFDAGAYDFGSPFGSGAFGVLGLGGGGGGIEGHNEEGTG